MALTTVSTNMIGTGGLVQLVGNQTGAVATGTTLIPFDDTIPQNTEGVQFLTQAITPTSATNKLVIDATLILNTTTAGHMCVALFQDSTANALAATWNFVDATGETETIHFRHIMTAGTTSSTTFQIRAGQNNSNTTILNGGDDSARKYGGVLASSLTIMEISV